MLFKTLAGLPTTTELSGILFVTTLLAPTTTLFPICTPGSIIHPSPIYTLFPILIGAILSQSGCCSLKTHIPPS